MIQRNILRRVPYNKVAILEEKDGKTTFSYFFDHTNKSLKIIQKHKSEMYISFCKVDWNERLIAYCEESMNG